jgi:hypothetical protein
MELLSGLLVHLFISSIVNDFKPKEVHLNFKDQ